MLQQISKMMDVKAWKKILLDNRFCYSCVSLSQEHVRPMGRVFWIRIFKVYEMYV